MLSTRSLLKHRKSLITYCSSNKTMTNMLKPATPKTDEILEYIKENNLKIDLMATYELNKMKNYEIKIFNMNKFITIMPWIVLPNVFIWYGTILNVDSTLGILALFSLWYICSKGIVYEYNKDIDNSYLSLIKRYDE